MTNRMRSHRNTRLVRHFELYRRWSRLHLGFDHLKDRVHDFGTHSVISTGPSAAVTRDWIVCLFGCGGYGDSCISHPSYTAGRNFTQTNANRGSDCAGAVGASTFWTERFRRSGGLYRFDGGHRCARMRLGHDKLQMVSVFQGRRSALILCAAGADRRFKSENGLIPLRQWILFGEILDQFMAELVIEKEP